MQSLLMAISDFIASLFYVFSVEAKEVASPPISENVPAENVPVGYNPLYFLCWLCGGKTQFACKNSSNKDKFTIECSRCGVENLVSVNK